MSNHFPPFNSPKAPPALLELPGIWDGDLGHLEAMKLGIWKGSHNPILRGRNRSPWSSTTYQMRPELEPPFMASNSIHTFSGPIMSTKTCHDLGEVSLGFGILSTRIFQLMIDNFFGKKHVLWKMLGPNTYPCYPRLYLLVWWLENNVYASILWVPNLGS